MKKILALLSLIFLFFAGYFIAGNFSFGQNYSDCFVLTSAHESISDIVDEGVIQSYSLTDENYFLSKKENNNLFNIYNELVESQLGSAYIKNLDGFDARIALSHSNNSLNLSRVYLTQASPRAP